MNYWDIFSLQYVFRFEQKEVNETKKSMNEKNQWNKKINKNNAYVRG